MGKFIIQVTGNVYGENASYNAYQFCLTALKADHKVDTVFFYQNGVSHSNMLVSPASDEFNLYQAWVDLATTYNVKLVNCVSAALRRGLLSQDESRENGQTQFNVSSPFIMGGLGELIIAIEKSDRLIRF